MWWYISKRILGGNLTDVISEYSKKSQSIPEELVFYFLFQIISGIAFMHSNFVLHRDLKPDNILLNKRKIVKICDFGISKEMKKVYCQTYIGTPLYMAPELINEKCIYNFPADIWSIGCIAYEMCCLKVRLTTYFCSPLLTIIIWKFC